MFSLTNSSNLQICRETLLLSCEIRSRLRNLRKYLFFSDLFSFLELFGLSNYVIGDGMNLDLIGFRCGGYSTRRKIEFVFELYFGLAW